MNKFSAAARAAALTSALLFTPGPGAPVRAEPEASVPGTEAKEAGPAAGEAAAKSPETAKPAEAAKSEAAQDNKSDAGQKSETKTGETGNKGDSKDAAAPKTETPPAPAQAVAASTADPVVESVRRKLSDRAFLGKADAEDVAALNTFYAGRSQPLWISASAYTAKAKAVLEELMKADDWGLDARAFTVPGMPASANAEQQAEAEVRLSLAALKYASFARGGRIEPLALSNILDMKPPLKDPKVVISELANSAEPDAYLRGLNPKHPQFKALRQALLKERGPAPGEDKIDEALKVKLPETGTVKPGAEHPDVALLRKRLKIEAQSASNENLYDAKLEAAVKAFQEEKGLKANGQLTDKTRKALNREGEPKKADPKGRTDLILVNMERWRWLPEDMSGFYVINNIPEFQSRVMKNGEEVFKTKIIVGQPTWPTPVLTASMEFVIFHPEWGVPDGIKVKELLPRLKKASGGGFFEELFGGGSSGGGRVLQAYKLQPTLNGRPVDADKIDWNHVDIRQFSFTQPAGSENPLGFVKFRFPNRHDVYMHDTPQRDLFRQSFRALSHGCMRVENPKLLAEVLLAEDHGWSAADVDRAIAGSKDEITLKKPIPVYLTYFTAVASKDGKLETFGDIYGHDSKLMQALEGRPVRYNAPDHSKEDITASSGDDPIAVPADPAAKKKGKKGQQAVQTKQKGGETAGDILSNALSGLIAN